MSVGNLKDEGNKGNNFPFQLSVLRGLQAVANVITGVGSGKARVTSVLRPTTAGTIAAGANSVSIANVGTANGTVKTINIKPGEIVNFNAGAINNVLDAIAYSATGTEFLIITVV